MSKTIILPGMADDLIGSWVAERIGNTTGWNAFRAIGLAEGGNLLVGIVYTDFLHPTISMHVAAVPGRRWMNRDILRIAFEYPFKACDCARVTGWVAADNEDALRFDKHLGFREEGRMRKALPGGRDLLLLGMLKEECRWISHE